VLEIDARLPSQTPLAVYHATGVNMVHMLASVFLSPFRRRRQPPMRSRGVILEHVRVTPEGIFIEGEHIMAQAGPLDRITGFFGADEALTNYRKDAPCWVATLIVGGRTRLQAEQRRDRVLASIQNESGIAMIVDSRPEDAR